MRKKILLRDNRLYFFRLQYDTEFDAGWIAATGYAIGPKRHKTVTAILGKGWRDTFSVRPTERTTK